MDKALQIVKSKPLKDERQYLYPEMVFYCHGKVTKWIYGGTFNYSQHKTKLPELQIWRQTSIHNYMKIASCILNGSTIISTNLYQFIPQPPLQFQEGDIFGIYVPSKDENPLTLYTQYRNGPKNLPFHSNHSWPEINEMHNVLSSDEVDFPLVTAEISKHFILILIFLLHVLRTAKK